jgi:hypothetical protein
MDAHHGVDGGEDLAHTHAADLHTEHDGQDAPTADGAIGGVGNAIVAEALATIQLLRQQVPARMSSQADVWGSILAHAPFIRWAGPRLKLMLLVKGGEVRNPSFPSSTTHLKRHDMAEALPSPVSTPAMTNQVRSAQFNDLLGG